MEAFKQFVTEYGTRYPWALFVALVFLPGIGFPAGVLLLLAGIVWGSHYTSCLIALAAIALNVMWTHCLAAGPARKVMTRWMGERLQPWFALPRTDLMKIAWLLRVTPGVPLFVQNYALGALGVPLRLSLLTALPVVSLYACGFVLTGGAIFDGRLGLAISGLALVAAAAIATRLFPAKQAKPGPEGGA
ncbi:VTT domain-containing protein [Luteolibacter arcticus]|uniref:VTT domain-containing protein n=1 Tax=Luteolibacter arcticus TaxID=1581411 RepID=A0ABT3GJ35_9BACT|nr:VTT domain-containing protein [Luteolibacter arcticus]MCW1923518.1 VTT domain-containing protein [Luteolibacter arcticus]